MFLDAPMPVVRVHAALLTQGLCSLASQRLGQFLEPFFQLQRKLLVTLLANGLHVKLNKLVPAGRKE